ncbi:putative ribonuclease H-like domain-containing protein [Tanacetum coccineum]
MHSNSIHKHQWSPNADQGSKEEPQDHEKSQEPKKNKVLKPYESNPRRTKLKSLIRPIFKTTSSNSEGEWSMAVDIDSLTIYEYVPVTAVTISKDSARMLIMVNPKNCDDAQKAGEDGLNNEDVNKESPDVIIGGVKLNDVSPSVNTASSNEHDSPEDMFTIGIVSEKRAIRTKWVFRNKKDERGIVIRNKARGKIDQTLFIKKQKEDILLVQVYVDDIIFGSTNKELCTAFEKLMKDKFQMSSIRELTFFLGLQVKQKEDGIFISQDKYVAEILKKFNYTDVKYMIGYLSYLTASRPDIMFAVCLWYSRDSPFELVAYTDSDYAKATQDKKSTIGGCQFLGNRLISWQYKKQTMVATSTTEAEYVAAASYYGQVL